MQRSLATARQAVFARDGKVLYTSNDGDIWLIGPGGDVHRQLTSNRSKDSDPIVSHDGNHVFFTSNRSGSNQIWKMRMDGSGKIQLTQEEGGYPRFVTPDGKWVYYDSALNLTLWKVSANGGRQSLVSDEKIFAPSISPDGKLLAYSYRDRAGKNENAVAIISIKDNKLLKTLGPTVAGSDLSNIIWSNDQDRLYYVMETEAENFLCEHWIEEDLPRRTVDLGSEKIAGLALSPDGKDFLLVRGDWTHDVMLIEQF